MVLPEEVGPERARRRGGGVEVVMRDYWGGRKGGRYGGEMRWGLGGGGVWGYWGEGLLAVRGIGYER